MISKKKKIFLSLKSDLVLANSADPDEMLHYALCSISSGSSLSKSTLYEVPRLWRVKKFYGLHAT